MRDVSGTRFAVNWDLLKANGIDRNAPVTLKIRKTWSASKSTGIGSQFGGQRENARLIAASDETGITIVPVDARAFLPKPVEEKKAEAAAEELLNRRLPQVKFAATRFSDAIDYLRGASGAQIFVNWKAMESLGVLRDVPVTMDLKNVKLSRCLTLLLSLVAPEKFAARIHDRSGHNFH